MSEVVLWKMQKQDSIAVINRLRMTPVSKSRLLISLCYFRTLPLVRPIIEGDIQRLENEFVNGYCEGDRVLYVFPYNNFDRSLDISDAIKGSWSDLWKVTNERFNKRLAQDEDLAPLSSKMFFVYEGNHHQRPKLLMVHLFVQKEISTVADGTALQYKKTT